VREIVRKLVAKALDGELDAIQEILNRMDGSSGADAPANKTPLRMTVDQMA
jgi:hypothetical protein